MEDMVQFLQAQYKHFLSMVSALYSSCLRFHPLILLVCLAVSLGAAARSLGGDPGAGL
jgi:hypothetical protein